ncbi:unnamed protein product [Cylicostephanus goldi]|uniref:Transthyretin/hydroxyisourate hydrolase domain-containing protein n=1 Tax=Cylicostephanus goldi TaxID=71465 RepID=A0A3P6S5G8_CYLGO|nr:unnamed protein product [Cylicostephanus goldi]
MQNITVKGTTICNKKRLPNILVELLRNASFISQSILIKENFTSTTKIQDLLCFTVDPDDLLDSKMTDTRGEFTVKGGQNEIGSIEPYLRITHTCNAKPGCKRITEFDIPKSKINTVYDMTYVTLDIISAKDKEKC